MDSMPDIAENYEAVQERIVRAAQKAGRNPKDITLIAVTKTWPATTVLAAHAAGIRHVGENRAEELAEKRPFVDNQIDVDDSLTWHLIGILQSRKTQLAATHADSFHALDRLKIARRLSAQRAVLNSPLPVFLEVNVSGEMSKSGVQADKWERDATQQQNLRTVVQAIGDLPGLQVRGLMTMATWGAPQDEILAVFQRTRALAEWLETAVTGLSLPHLSMGMTDDFELAIAAGATMVRVGRAIFGAREYA